MRGPQSPRRNQFTRDKAILCALREFSSPRERSRGEVQPVDEGQPAPELQAENEPPCSHSIGPWRRCSQPPCSHSIGLWRRCSRLPCSHSIESWLPCSLPPCSHSSELRLSCSRRSWSQSGELWRLWRPPHPCRQAHRAWMWQQSAACHDSQTPTVHGSCRQPADALSVRLSPEYDAHVPQSVAPRSVERLLRPFHRCS